MGLCTALMLQRNVLLLHDPLRARERELRVLMVDRFDPFGMLAPLTQYCGVWQLRTMLGWQLL